MVLRRVILFLLGALHLCAGALAEEEKGAENTDREKEPPKTIAEVAKLSQKYRGLFTIYQDLKTGDVYLTVTKDQLDKEYIYFVYTLDGVVEAGHFRGETRDNRVISIRKHFNKIEFVSENTGFYFDEKSPLSRASEANISPSVLNVQEIEDEDPNSGEYLIKANSLFLTESFHQVKPSPAPDAKPGESFSLGKLSKEKTKFLKIRSYPKNTDIIVEYVYENPEPIKEGGPSVTDSRNVSIKIQHTLIEMPVNDYRPRFDDPRIGYFARQVTDLTSTSATPYRDVIQRWHLQKKDKTAPISDPVEPIVWWIENSTPLELRDTIRDAALAWNEAFLEAGFRNAIVVKTQPPDADWDAGDIRYNVLRWTSSPEPPFGGYGPSFVNPRTGQTLGADIQLEYVFLTRNLSMHKLFAKAALGWEERAETFDPRSCSLGHDLHEGVLFGTYALGASDANALQVDEFLKSALYYLILHELGHTLGLSHNMKSSHLHSPEDVQNKDLTARVGLTGSVMDYPTPNFAPPGQEQGDYFTKKPGPYDKWAITYGYSEALDDPAAERQRLAKILARSTEPSLAFGNDADDMRSPATGIDPRVMVRDLTSDPIGYAVGRMELIEEVTQKLRASYSTAGESYHELRNAYLVLTGQQRTAANVISRYIGGVYVDRAVVGQPGASQPFRPVSLKDQKRAMDALRNTIFAPDAFDTPEDLYNHLQMQRRGFDFFSEPEDPKIHERVLNIQRSILDHLLHPRVLTRISDSRLYGNEYSLTAFMEDLEDAIFSDDLKTQVNTFRQNLQVEFVKRLIAILPGARPGTEKAPGKKQAYDTLSQSMALHRLRSIHSTLSQTAGADTETRAHREHLLFLIDRALKTD